MTPELREKLSKIYELVKRGTDGEQAAAQAALDRMLDKYGLEGIDLESLDRSDYRFTYISNLEADLLTALYRYFIDGDARIVQYTDIKRIQISLRYLDYVTLNCAYEYFRRHMKAQWNKTCAPDLAKCRKAKNRNKRRLELQEVFFSTYILASKLYKPHQVKDRDLESMSAAQLQNLMKVAGVEGGEYNRQVVGGLLLN
jgi:hypothetical protein